MLLLALAGCAGVQEQPQASDKDIAWVLAGAGMLPESGGALVEDPQVVLHVSDEMRQFAEKVTLGKGGTKGRTAALAAALGSEDGLNLQYDSQATLTAEEVFKQRRANCLSYTLLFVALAREVDVPAVFNEVDIPPIWDMGDDTTSLLYRHVNARVDLYAPFMQIVDISGGEYDPSFDQRVIPDSSALAQFYNNRAVEFRLRQHHAEALAYQLRALSLAPDTAYLWTNLASLYLQIGNAQAARTAIARSLMLDSTDMLGYDTAAQIYDKLGDHRRAAHFHDRAQQFLDQNPYYHFQLALAANRKHDEPGAYTEIQRAIALYPKEPRFFALQAAVFDQLGDRHRARDSMQTAIDLAPDGAQQERYRSKFARLAKQG